MNMKEEICQNLSFQVRILENRLVILLNWFKPCVDHSNATWQCQLYYAHEQCANFLLFFGDRKNQKQDYAFQANGVMKAFRVTLS